MRARQRRLVPSIMGSLGIYIAGLSALANEPMPMGAPIYAGPLIGLSQCGPNHLVLSSDTAVFELSKLDGRWQRGSNQLEAKPGGVLCSEDGQLLLVATDQARNVYRRSNDGWQLLQAPSLGEVVFAGPDFLIGLPSEVRGSSSTVKASIISEDARNAAPVSMSFQDLITFSRDLGLDVSQIEIADPLEGGVPEGILLRNMRLLSKHSGAIVFDFGDTSRRYIGWAKSGFEHWDIHPAPPTMFRAKLHREGSTGLVLGTRRLVNSVFESLDVFDCSTAEAQSCIERHWDPTGGQLDAVVIGDSGYLLAYRRSHDCFQLVKYSMLEGECRALPPPAKSLTPASLVSDASMAVVEFVDISGPDYGPLNVQLFDLWPRH